MVSGTTASVLILNCSSYCFAVPKLDGAFRAEQEFDAEFLFEVENGLADCGLCHVKAARSFAEVQILGYTHEVAEMAQFHGSACYRQIRLLQANHTIYTISKIMRQRRCGRHEAEKPEI